MAQQPEEQKENWEEKLCQCIRDNDMDELRMVLLEDVDLNKLAAYGKGTEKITPLFVACQCKNVEAVKLLLRFKSDAKIKSFPSGNTPLHIASGYASAKICELLLEKGADPVVNNNKGKNPLQIIGNKYKIDSLDDQLMEDKMETQIILLNAGSKRATNFQQEIDDDIADAEDGLAGLKMESNARIKKAEKSLQKRFDSTHPYLYCKMERMRAWKQKNKCTVQEYLHKRYIKVKVPQWDDKKNSVTHVDLSKVQSFQLAIAKELLSKSGLNLLPEPKPILPKGVKAKTEKPTKKTFSPKSKK